MMEEENRGLHQEVSSFMSEVSITVSLFFTHQQVRQRRKERTHSQHMVEQAQQRTRKMGEENRGLQQQVSLHDDIDCKVMLAALCTKLMRFQNGGYTAVDPNSPELFMLYQTYVALCVPGAVCSLCREACRFARISCQVG